MRRLQLTILAIALSLTLSAQGQSMRVAPTRFRPQGTMGDTLTLTATPSAVSFTLQHGATATGSAGVVIVTSYGGLNLFFSLNLYGYFASSTAALSGGTPVAYIPTSCVLGQMTTGNPTSFTAFTSTTVFGGAGASLQLYTNGPALVLYSSRTDTLNLEINLSSLPQLPAATYTGTLTLVAQAY
jgi:hypothetical protein